jgi:small-conductance mechanosensitive channel
MTKPLTAHELTELLNALTQPSALTEAAVLLTCLLAAWGLTRLARGTTPRRASIVFGEGLFDGVLFPLLALLLAFGARYALQGTVPLAVFKLAVPILLSLAAIRLTVRVLTVAFPQSRPMRVLERWVSWVAWIAVALWVTGILPTVMDALDDVTWKMGTTHVSLRNLIEGTLSVVVVLIIALWVSAAVEAQLLKGATSNLSLRKIAANATRAALLFVGLLIALSAAGIDLTALSVLGGAIGVGLGFGLQKLASNYVSGFVILAERSLRIGDMVKVDNFEGRITDINTRYTVIRALSGREAIVPNELLITQRIENLSLADPRVLLSTVVQVAYGTDLDALLPRLVEAVDRVPRVLGDPAPGVQLSAFAADGLELTVLFWIEDPHNGQGNVKSDVNLAVLRALGAAGVEIPFPQRVLHGAGTPLPQRPEG